MRLAFPVGKTLISTRRKSVSLTLVTLHKEGRLRGCIGSIYPIRPLYREVMSRAQDAALNDRRFKPVKKEEVKDLHIEISVLTPPRSVKSWRDIEIGKHGIILEKGGGRAVFLPQVAPEQGWDRETTLTHLSRKAGLSGDAWKTGTEFYVFEAQIFHEQE